MMNKRNQMIDLARMIFCLAVVSNHWNSMVNGSESVYITTRYGYLSVEFFFVVSGYLMAAGLKKYQNISIGLATGKNLLSKYKHILPYYCIAWILGMIAQHLSSTVAIQQIAKDAIRSVPAFLGLEMLGVPLYQANGPTWYISAMLVAILVTFPLLYKFKEKYSGLIAPIISILGYSYLLATVGHFSTILPLENNIVYTGLIRGLAGMSLGCTCHRFANIISHRTFSLCGKKVLTTIEIGSYVLALLLMNSQGWVRPDFYVIILFAIAVTLTFSCKSFTAQLKLPVNSGTLGKLSLVIYLADSPARALTMKLLPDAGRDFRIIPSLLILLCFSTIVYFTGNLLAKMITTGTQKIRNSCLDEDVNKLENVGEKGAL